MIRPAFVAFLAAAGIDSISVTPDALPGGAGLAFAPDFDVKETKDSFVFRADVPGINESDLDVAVTGDRVTVSGSRESEEEQQGERYYSCERRYGSFTRSFTLPTGADADQTRADLKAGVLTLVVPKLPEAQSKKVPIKAEAKSEKAKG